MTRALRPQPNLAADRCRRHCGKMPQLPEGIHAQREQPEAYYSRSEPDMPASQTSRGQLQARTKIVATLGPATASEDSLAELALAGADVFRINTAHGDRQEHQKRFEAVRAVSRRLGQPIAILVDLAGPKIRLGELPAGQLRCEPGAIVRFVRGREAAGPNELTTTYQPLVDELAVGNRVMLADGTVCLVVEQLGQDYAECRVVQPGVIRSRQGVNLPGAKLSAPSLSVADRQNAVWAAQAGADFVGLSFVRAADDVRELKNLLRSNASDAHVIAKIEKPEALDHLEEIVQAADGVMVARGDLGVETDIAQMALVQKHVIATCNRFHKPAIVATQMLDSMQHSQLPTRAEVTDVANAILDGADACMLSGETAIGEYAREAVEMMHRIALATEPTYRKSPPLHSPDSCTSAVNPITEAAVRCAGRIAAEVDAKLVVVASSSGATALSLSKNRNYVPTVGVSNSEATLRRMCLYWGVIPLPGAPTQDSAALLAHIVAWGTANGSLKAGDRIVLVSGTGLSVSAHNMIVVHMVG